MLGAKHRPTTARRRVMKPQLVPTAFLEQIVNRQAFRIQCFTHLILRPPMPVDWGSTIFLRPRKGDAVWVSFRWRRAPELCSFDDVRLIFREDTHPGGASTGQRDGGLASAVAGVAGCGD